MRDLRYKPKTFRLNEETYEKLVKLRKKEKLSWNLLLLKLLKKYGK